MEITRVILYIFFAILPGALIGFYIYQIDKKRSTSVQTVAVCVLYGVLSAFVALGLIRVIDQFSNIEEDNMIHQMIRAVIFVGLVEEGAKFIFLRGVLFRHQSFTQPFNGIVYAIMIGMGFATTENLLYLINGGEDVIILRMFTAVPAHAIFALIMGFFIGEAKIFQSSSGLYSITALAFATLAHGYYDYFLFLNFIPGIWWQAFISLAIVIILAHVVFEYRKDEIIDHD